MHQSFNTEALVLKRTNVGETDRVVTLFTPDQGKIAVIAKGVRQLKSSKSAYLEPGNHIKCSLIHTKSLPILTQATLVSDTQGVRENLSQVRQLLQLLEITDKLFVEQDENSLFFDILAIRRKIIDGKASAAWVRQAFENIISELGYEPFNTSEYQTISEYVSALADRPLRAYEYLKVGN